jgi:hypothetical protein
MGTELQFIPGTDPRNHQSKKTPGIAGRFFHKA